MYTQTSLPALHKAIRFTNCPPHLYWRLNITKVDLSLEYET
jgi:hypothetical protein